MGIEPQQWGEGRRWKQGVCCVPQCAFLVTAICMTSFRSLGLRSSELALIHDFGLLDMEAYFLF